MRLTTRRHTRMAACPRSDESATDEKTPARVTRTVHRDAEVCRPWVRVSLAWLLVAPAPRRTLRPADRPAWRGPPRSRATPTTDRATAPSSTQTDQSTTPVPGWCHQIYEHSSTTVHCNKKRQQQRVTGNEMVNVLYTIYTSDVVKISRPRPHPSRPRPRPSRPRPRP